MCAENYVIAVINIIIIIIMIVVVVIVMCSKLVLPTSGFVM
jgi:hypothetical protein